jgi:hypothetical protein
MNRIGVPFLGRRLEDRRILPFVFPNGWIVIYSSCKGECQNNGSLADTNMCIIARVACCHVHIVVYFCHPQVGNFSYVLDRPLSVGQRRAITNTRKILVFATADTHRRHPSPITDPFRLISATGQNNFRAHNTNHQSTKQRCASHQQ